MHGCVYFEHRVVFVTKCDIVFIPPGATVFLTATCGTWQFRVHNCGFDTFVCVSMAMHMTAFGVRVITIKRHIQFGSVRG